jgi:teichuronic acid exporter
MSLKSQMASKQRESVNSGVRWTSSETVVRISCNMINMVVLTRLLAPSDFGLFALLMPMTMILGVLIDSGLSVAVVQKLNLTDDESSSVYWLQLFVSIIGAIALASLAPTIAKFFDHDILSSILWVLLIGVVIRTTGSVMGERLHRDMQFSKLSKIFIYSSVISTIISIISAFNGFGVWAIVASSLANSALMAGGIWISASWRPKFHFSSKEAFSLIPFGLKVLSSNILNNVNELAYTSLLGKAFGFGDLGIFTRAKSFSNNSLNATEAITRRVTLPLFSSLQQNRSETLRNFRSIFQSTIFLIAPVMSGIAVLSEPLVALVFGQKWLLAAQFVPIFSALAIANTMKSSLSSVIISLGHPSRLLYLNILFVIIGLSGLFVTYSLGLKAVALSLTFASIVHLFGMLWVVNKLIGYSFQMVIRDLAPPLICSAIMTVSVSFVGCQISSASSLLRLFALVPVGVLSYFLLSVIVLRAPLERLMTALRIPLFRG